MFNALMGAVARSSNSLGNVMALYRHTLETGLQPDEYTFNAILTAIGRVGADLNSIEIVVHEMHRCGAGQGGGVGPYSPLLAAWVRT